MGALRGFVSGGVALSAMYLVVTSNQKGLNTAANMPGKVLHYLIDPNTPLIPDLGAQHSATTPGDPQAPPGTFGGRNVPGSTSGTTGTGTKSA